MCSVQLIFSILRHTFSSKTSNLVMSPFLVVLISAQYKLGHTSNQCFHHSFLEASSLFSLLNPPLGNSFLLVKASFPLLSRGVNPGAEGRDPQILGRGSQGGSLESWTGREILLYLIMYRKYVRKWLLLKRNRIICEEVAVNGQFFAWKIDFFNCLKK